MAITISGDSPNFSSATITSGTITTGTVTTLNAPSGVLATQNGMTGIAKAWVNFDGTGTPSIRSSFNVSSITDNGTGDYTVNFTTAMPNANYTVSGVAQQSTLDGVARNMIAPWTTAPTTTALRLATGNPGLGTLFDASYVYVQVLGS